MIKCGGGGGGGKGAVTVRKMMEMGDDCGEKGGREQTLRKMIWKRGREGEGGRRNQAVKSKCNFSKTCTYRTVRTWHHLKGWTLTAFLIQLHHAVTQKATTSITTATDLLWQPHPQDWHASDDGVGVLLCCWVDRVVGADDQDEVSVGEVIVELVHLQDDIIGNSSLRQ